MFNKNKKGPLLGDMTIYDSFKNKVVIDGVEFKGFQKDKAVDFNEDGIKIHTTVANPLFKLLVHPDLVTLILGHLKVVMLVDRTSLSIENGNYTADDSNVPNVTVTMTGATKYVYQED